MYSHRTNSNYNQTTGGLVILHVGSRPHAEIFHNKYIVQIDIANMPLNLSVCL